ncbi:MAG: cupin domain-containing protein [Acidimicrobiia bacterium]
MSRRQDPIVVVAPSDRRAGPPTPGLQRQEAFSSDDLWAGLVRTEARMASGWHHHGEYQTIVYVLAGALRMEFGPRGSTAVDARPGDFVVVPKGVVHRESNPSFDTADLVVVRAGRGESTFNVEDPPRD